MRTDPGNISASINLRNGNITFLDNRKSPSKKPNSRIVTPGRTGEFNSLAVSQSFTPKDEFLFGRSVQTLSEHTRTDSSADSGKFATSIYGHIRQGLRNTLDNYGLVDYNPSETIVELQQGEADGTSVVVDATGTAGNIRERRSFNDFSGEFEVSAGGEYSLLLDVGQSMARKHFMMIDGDTVIDVTPWLPPTSSIIINLKQASQDLCRRSRGDRPSVE